MKRKAQQELWSRSMEREFCAAGRVFCAAGRLFCAAGRVFCATERVLRSTWRVLRSTWRVLRSTGRRLGRYNRLANDETKTPPKSAGSRGYRIFLFLRLYSSHLSEGK